MKHVVVALTPSWEGDGWGVWPEHPTNLSVPSLSLRTTQNIASFSHLSIQIFYYTQLHPNQLFSALWT